MARGFSQGRSEIAGYGVSDKSPFASSRTRTDGGYNEERRVEVPSRLEYDLLKREQQRDIELGKMGGPNMDRERNAKIFAYEEAQRQKEKEEVRRKELADALRPALQGLFEGKKPKKKAEKSAIVEENPKRLFDYSQGIGGGAYERNQSLKAQLEAEGVTGIAGPRGIMPVSVPTYSPDELREAERIQKGEIRIMEGPGAAERRRQRIEATKAANRARLQGDFGDLSNINYSRTGTTGSKPKKRK